MSRPGLAVPLVVLGPGRVGRALLSLISSRREHLALRLGIRLDVMAVGDRSGLVVAQPGGLSDQALARLIALKSAGGALADWPQGDHSAHLASSILGHEVESATAAPILVDTTAADTTASLLDARRRGWRLVLANKVPLTAERGAFDAILCGGAGARWETTVAGSLPAVQALQTLVDSGDEVRWITGSLSGTIGFLLASVEGGTAFSAAVARAIERGLAEPDPRNDLSGRDAARKALILARMIGYDIDLDQVQLTGLVAPTWLQMAREEFAGRLAELDESLSGRIARQDGVVTRYLATIGHGTVRVGLVDVGRHSPLAAVDASNSAVVFESTAYRGNPLVVSGRTEGPAGTAQGVLSDIVSLCRESPPPGRRGDMASGL